MLTTYFNYKMEKLDVAIASKRYNLSTKGEIFEFSIENANGMQAKVTNYGGYITALNVPDRDGQFADVVLGYDDLAVSN